MKVYNTWTKNKVIRINICFIISYLLSAIYENEMEGLFTELFIINWKWK